MRIITGQIKYQLVISNNTIIVVNESTYFENKKDKMIRIQEITVKMTHATNQYYKTET